MLLSEELTAFYQRNGFGEVVGRRPATVAVYTGCLLVPMPNIETRRRYLKYHDLHHLMTGYSVGRIGEGETSAWELGTGSALTSPLLAVMNLIALSTGLVLEPVRMWRAFVRGTNSRNLYSSASRGGVDAGKWRDLEELRSVFLDRGHAGTRLRLLRHLEFALYSAAAMLIHAAIAIPALIARFVTDIMLEHSLFRAIKPRKRQDLY